MSYQAQWTQADSSGRLVEGLHAATAQDVAELAAAVNRRRRLVYLAEEDFSTAAVAGQYIHSGPLNAEFPPPFTNLRFSVEAKLVNAQTGLMGGGPPASPTALDWLWPVEDGDEGKVIVNGFTGVGEGEVSLFAKLNGGSDWTDSSLVGGQTYVRAVHINELRQSLEWLRRGRWGLPFYGVGGIFSVAPDASWISERVYNSGSNEIRCTGFLKLRTYENPPRGLTGVTVRPGSTLSITAEENCSISVYHCLRPIEWLTSLPTWNRYNPAASLAWSSPGGLGDGDADCLGTVACTQNQPACLGGSALAAALQAMVDGQPQHLLFRRADTGPTMIRFTSQASVEFELASPPN